MVPIQIIEGREYIEGRIVQRLLNISNLSLTLRSGAFPNRDEDARKNGTEANSRWFLTINGVETLLVHRKFAGCAEAQEVYEATVDQKQRVLFALQKLAERNPEAAQSKRGNFPGNKLGRRNARQQITPEPAPKASKTKTQSTRSKAPRARAKGKNLVKSA